MFLEVGLWISATIIAAVVARSFLQRSRSSGDMRVNIGLTGGV